MEHPYEYAMMVNPLTPDRPVDLSKEADLVPFIKAVGRFTHQLPKALESLLDGGWETVSHDVAVHGTTILVTMLLRRPRKKK